jgi:1,4-alpha-glucan branching enzyme
MVQLQVDGSVQFELFMPDAATVALAGSFTDWRDRAIDMRGPEDGWWTLRLHLPPGEHEFQYLVDGDIWLADYAAHGVKRNRSGMWVSLLTLEADTAPQPNPTLRAA